MVWKIRVEGLGWVRSKSGGSVFFAPRAADGHAFETRSLADKAAEQVRQINKALLGGAEVVEYVPPPAPLVLEPTNEERISLEDGVLKLDTGMRVDEAIARAAAWWEAKGRRLMAEHKERQAKPVEYGGAGGAFASRDPADPNFMPSGLIHSEPWEALDKREKIQVVKVWHHFTIRKPDLIGGAEDPYKLGERSTVQ